MGVCYTLSMNYCELCFSSATFYGEIFPDFEFIKWGKNDYSIVQGHDEIFRFPEPPLYVNPIPDDLTDEQMDERYLDEEISKKDLEFCEAVERLRMAFHFSPQLGRDICLAAEKQGWIPLKHGWLDYWVMDRAAKMIKEKEANGH